MRRWRTAVAIGSWVAAAALVALAVAGGWRVDTWHLPAAGAQWEVGLGGGNISVGRSREYGLSAAYLAGDLDGPERFGTHSTGRPFDWAGVDASHDGFTNPRPSFDWAAAVRFESFDGVSGGFQGPWSWMRRFEIVLPLGLLATVAAWPGLAVATRRAVGRRGRRRHAAGRCVACGYDLRETPDRCPECGRKPAVPRRLPRARAAFAAGCVLAPLWLVAALGTGHATSRTGHASLLEVARRPTVDLRVAFTRGGLLVAMTDGGVSTRAYDLTRNLPGWLSWADAGWASMPAGPWPERHFVLGDDPAFAAVRLPAIAVVAVPVAAAWLIVRPFRFR